MTGFKKWWKDDGFHYEYEAMCEDAWKEALKWVKDKLECEIQPGDIEYFIDKELKEN